MSRDRPNPPEQTMATTHTLTRLLAALRDPDADPEAVRLISDLIEQELIAAYRRGRRVVRVVDDALLDEAFGSLLPVAGRSTAGVKILDTARPRHRDRRPTAPVGQRRTYTAGIEQRPQP